MTHILFAGVHLGLVEEFQDDWDDWQRQTGHQDVEDASHLGQRQGVVFTLLKSQIARMRFVC